MKRIFVFRFVRKTIYTLLGLIVLLASLLGFLLFTTPGLYTSVKIAQLFLPGTLNVKQLKGRLGTTFSIGKLNYEDAQQQLMIEHFDLKWHPQALFKGKLWIQNIRAKQLLLHLKQGAAEQKHDTANGSASSFSFPELPLELSIEALDIHQLTLQDGKNQQHIQDIYLQVELNRQQWQLKTLALRYQQQQLNSRISLQAQYPYQLKGKIHLSPAKKDQGQALAGDLFLSGDFNHYQWQGVIHQPSKLNLHGSLKNGQQLTGLIRWQQLSLPITKKKQFQSSQGQIQLSGTLPELNIKLSSQIEAPLHGQLDLQLLNRKTLQRLQFRLSGQQGEIQGRVQQQGGLIPSISGTINGHWQDAEELVSGLGQIKINSSIHGTDTANLSASAFLDASYWQQPLHAQINYNNQQLNARVNLGRNQLTLRGSPPFQWQIKGNLPELSLLNPKLAGLKGGLNIDGKLQGSQQGQFDIHLLPGSYQPPEQDELEPLNFQGGRIAARLTPAGLNSSGVISIDAEKRIHLRLNMPGFDLSTGVNDEQSIDLQVDLLINSLAFLSQISPHIESSAGQMNVKLSTQGTLKHLRTDLQAKISQFSAQLPIAGLKLHQGELSLNADHKLWKLNGVVFSEGQPLRISGQGNHFPEAQGKIEISGTAVQLFNTKDYSIKASPNLELSYKDNLLKVSGNLLIPEAVISPQTFSESVSLSDDVIFKSEQDEQSRNKLELNVSVTMGDKVNLDIQGLKGQLVGAINLRQQPEGALTASGNLHVAKGAYKAHGQDLTIEQGDLFFTGGLITNPGINVRAVRRFNNTQSMFSGSNRLFDFTNSNVQNFNFSSQVTVGIQVTGRLTSPKISLFSSPPGLSQADILAMLILGRPAHQAGSSGGQLLLTAVSSMNLDSGSGSSQLMSQLQQNLGLDFDLQSSSSYNREANTVTESKKFHVGKQLSKRVYLSYDLGLFQSDTSVFGLKYLLNKYFSIQVNASDSASGLDVYYTRSFSP